MIDITVGGDGRCDPFEQELSHLEVAFGAIGAPDADSVSHTYRRRRFRPLTADLDMACLARSSRRRTALVDAHRPQPDIDPDLLGHAPDPIDSQRTQARRSEYGSFGHSRCDDDYNGRR